MSNLRGFGSYLPVQIVSPCALEKAIARNQTRTSGADITENYRRNRIEILCKDLGYSTCARKEPF